MPSKCFGERPACDRCIRKSELCIYDVAEGVSRQQDLRTRLQSAHAELGQTKGFIHTLQHSSDTDADALILFERLRSGEDMAQLVDIGMRVSQRYFGSQEPDHPRF